MASSTTRRHSRDDPREDVGKEVRVGVGVGTVECQLISAERGRSDLELSIEHACVRLAGV